MCAMDDTSVTGCDTLVRRFSQLEFARLLVHGTQGLGQFLLDMVSGMALMRPHPQDLHNITVTVQKSILSVSPNIEAEFYTESTLQDSMKYLARCSPERHAAYILYMATQKPNMCHAVMVRLRDVARRQQRIRSLALKRADNQRVRAAAQAKAKAKAKAAPARWRGQPPPAVLALGNGPWLALPDGSLS